MSGEETASLVLLLGLLVLSALRHARRLIFQLSERLFEGVLGSAGYRRRQAEGGYNHDLAERESAPGSRLVFNALSPHWRGPEDDKDGQEAWFTARHPLKTPNMGNIGSNPTGGGPEDDKDSSSGVQPELPSPVMPGGQALVAAERAGQADQDGRPSGAARAAIDLSVVRGVLDGCSRECWSIGRLSPAPSGITTILPRGRALQGVGLSSLQRTRLAHLLSEGVPGARRVADMLNEPERLLSTILLGNNLVNVAFSAIITVVVVSRAGEGNEGIAVVIATILGTVTLLLLGETIPKTIAVRESERLAFLYSYPLKWGEYLLLPFVLILQWITKMISRRVGGTQEDQRSITEVELRTLIDIGVGEGEFEHDEAERLKGVFRFGDRLVRDVMTPRTEIIFVQRGSTVGEFLKTYAEHSHTRFPVYWDTTDNVVGVLSLKDILRSLAVNGLTDDDSVTDVIRDVHFVPETKRIAELFDELRRSGNQMAIAVDEFGGVAGLVTLKQLIEDVMGRVGEEGIGAEEEMTLVGQDTYEVEGGMSIDEARDRLELDIEEGDFETVAGWALERLGHIPTQGETFEADDVASEIIEMDNLKIERLRLTKNRQTSNAGNEE